MRYLFGIALLLLTGCGVGLHIDNRGARIGKEQIERIDQSDITVYQIKFTGIGIFW